MKFILIRLMLVIWILSGVLGVALDVNALRIAFAAPAVIGLCLAIIWFIARGGENDDSAGF